MGTIREVDGRMDAALEGGSRAGLDACSHQAAARRSSQSLLEGAAALGKAACHPLSSLVLNETNNWRSRAGCGSNDQLYAQRGCR